MQPQFSKTDSRYWKQRVEKRRGKNFYGVQIQNCGERHFLSLGTGNKDEAATRAVKLFLDVKLRGWEAVLAEQRPKPKKRPATVGAYIAEAEVVAKLEPRTLNEYRKALRRIVSDIQGLDSPGKYDWRNGHTDEWRARIDSVSLETINTRSVQAWMNRKLAESGPDPAKQRAAKNTLNGVIRNAKALFGKKVLPFVSERLEVPSPHPFADVRLFPRQSMRYRSKIDAAIVIERAKAELASPREITSAEIDDFIESYMESMRRARRKRNCAGDFTLSDSRHTSLVTEAHQHHARLESSRRQQWRILVLALSAGLRFEEIDKLLWSQVDIRKQQIRIDVTPYFRPKTEEAIGDVSIEFEIAQLLQEWKDQATGEFVVEAGRPVSFNTSYAAYRTRTHHKRLLDWLRALEIHGERPLESVQKPIHELRKEAGSLVNAQHGLFDASKFLRHSDPRITAAHYLDQKHRATTGVGHLFSTSIPVRPEEG